MKHRIVVAVVLVVLAIGCYWAVTSLTAAIDKGTLKRTLGDVRSLVAAIESYRIDYMLYPRGFSVLTLEALEPTYIRSAPLRGVSYFSDGTDYALVVRPFTNGGPAAWAPFVVNNGQIESWPSQLDDETIDRFAKSLQELGEQTRIKSPEGD